MSVIAPIRVLVVDDSALVRSAYRMIFEEEPGFVVVGEAGDPYEARDLILQHVPDVITLDVEMPRMDGLTFLRRIMQHRPTPVVIVSSVAGRGAAAAIEALHAGAAEVLEKPTTAIGRQRFGPTLRDAVRAASTCRPRPAAPPGREGGRSGTEGAGPVPSQASRQPAGGWTAASIAIGSSTGGPQQLLDVVPLLPADLPPVVIVQHMPAGFTTSFADRMARVGGKDVKEAIHGEVLQPGMVRVAPGGRHVALTGTPSSLRLLVQDGPMINFHRPSVDLYFHTVARVCGPAAVGVILTGMGEDGARGLLAMRQGGAMTLGQDESSVVYGMPKAAWEIGAVRRQVGIQDMAAAIVAAARDRRQ